ncbi:MAG: tetratricopeptide repeat protein [Pseudomonadota bacterium]
MVDIFDEVNDELREEKLANFWKENGTFIIICVITVIVAVGGKSWWVHYTTEQNMEQTGQLIAALDQDDAAVLQDYAEETKGYHQMLSRLLSAGLMQDNATTAEDRAKAVENWRAVAENRDYPRVYRDLAILLATGEEADFDAADMDALLADLEPLTAEERPFRSSALELMAHLEASRGDYAKAIGHIDTLLEGTDNVPPSIQERAETLKAYYAFRTGDEETVDQNEG